MRLRADGGTGSRAVTAVVPLENFEGFGNFARSAAGAMGILLPESGVDRSNGKSREDLESRKSRRTVGSREMLLIFFGFNTSIFID